jgi:uncharacterized protein YdeI (BOF family)
MADEDLRPRDGDAQYQETTAPQNPPNSMIRPRARTGWLASSLGTLIAVFLIVAAVFIWVTIERSLGRGSEAVADRDTAGTSGVRDNSPGGFSADPTPGSTEDELKFRGATADSLTKMSDVKNGTAGQRVELHNVSVERTDGDTFWIRDDDVTVAVVAPGGSPTVKAGQKINVTGTIEGNADSTRVRASRIDVL